MLFFRRLALVFALLIAAHALPAQSTVPTLTQALPAQTIGVGGAPVNLDLRNYFSLPGVTGQIAQFNTVLGTFNVELLASAAPLSVANFLTYVGSGAYSNSMIHRSASLLGPTSTANWIVQGGGFDLNANPLATNAPIPLEYNLPNTAGTIAMARTSVLNSATSQWFFNVNDNTDVLGSSNGGGYAVFGRVLGSGLSVINAIAAVPVYDATQGNPASPFGSLPLQNVTVGQTTIQTANLIAINSITVVPIYPATNTSPAVLAFAVANNNSAAVTATLSGSTLTLTPVGAGTATISVRVADTNGNFASGAFNLTVTNPTITLQPVAQTINSGSTVVLSVAATGAPTPNYQWRGPNGNIAGATSATLVLSGTTGPTAALAGGYSCLVSNSVSSATSNTAALTVITTNNPGRLSNLSVFTDISAAVPNFTVATVIGPIGVGGALSLVVRADGPTLGAAPFNLAGMVADPQFTLYNGANQVITTNDNWGGGAALATAMASVGAFAFSGPGSLDAAVNPTGLGWGNYSVKVSGTNGATGNVLAEIYDATPAGTYTPASPRLINVSVLKQIPAGGFLTLGFTVYGATARTVLIRVIGPALGLTPFNIGGVMADPQLTLFDSNSQVIATNDDWGADPQLVSAVTRVNAFSIGSAPTKDAMLLVTLPVPPPQGAGYTARATGNGGTSGYAIVEVYEVP